MTRNQQIQNAAKVYTDCKDIESPRVKIAFEQGAKWADKNPIENTNKKWYVARDKNGDLYLYLGKPIKSIKEEGWHAQSGKPVYFENDEFPICNLFRNVKWEDEEPTEVEFTIKEINV